MAGQIKRWTRRVLRPMTRSWLNQTKMSADLEAIGIRQGGYLLVHSSLSSLGFVPGNASAVVAALRDSMGLNGTLVLPSHSWSWMNRGCREFDVRITPTCVGALPEFFRKQPGVVRSLHPTHSVAAIGPQAEQLIAGHQLAETPCGGKTPYEKLLIAGGQILFLGVDLSCNTAFHTVEALANVPYLMEQQPQPFDITDSTGKKTTIRTFMHAPHIPRRFAQTETRLLAEGIVTEGRIGTARTLLIDGPKFIDFMVPLLCAEPDFLRDTAGG